MLTSQSYCEDWLWYMEGTKNCSYYYSYCLTLGICSLNKHFFLKKVKCKLFKREYTPRAEKAMAPHSSTLAWKIPSAEEPGRLQSMWSLRVGHDWSDLAAAAYSQRGLPRWHSGKESTANAGDTRNMGLIPDLGRSPGVGNSNPLQYFCLENPMDRGAWWATACVVSKSWT